MSSPQFPFTYKDLNAMGQLASKYKDVRLERKKLPLLMHRVAIVAMAILSAYFLLMPIIPFNLVLFSMAALGTYALLKRYQVESKMFDVTSEMQKMFWEKVTTIAKQFILSNSLGTQVAELASRLRSYTPMKDRH